MKNEREIERIVCQDGEDNDESGTDGSFVMVMNGCDYSDVRSDSSEKDYAAHDGESAEIIPDESVKADHAQEEEFVAVEDCRDHKDEILNVGDLKRGEDLVIGGGDLKSEKEVDFECLNKKHEAIIGCEEETECEDEVERVLEQNLNKNDGNVELVELVFDKSDAIESVVTDIVNEEVDSVCEIEEVKKASEEISGDVESFITEKTEGFEDSSELAKEEISSVLDVDDGRDDNHGECEDAGNKEVDSNLEVVGESENVYDEGIEDVESASKESSSVFEIEDGRDDSLKKFEDCGSLVRDTAKKVEESKNNNDEGIKDVETEIVDHMDDEVNSVSGVEDGKIASDDLSDSTDCENKKKSVIQLDESLQIKATPAVPDDEGGELSTLVEQSKQHDVKASLPSSEVEEIEHDSSIKLVDEPVNKDSGSAPMLEEFAAADASSIDQSTEPGKKFISSTSQVEDEHDEALSTSSNQEPSNKEGVSAPETEEDRNSEILFNSSNPELKEDMDLAPTAEEKPDLDASFTDSKPEPISLLASTSEVGEIKDADAPSIDSIPEPVNEDVGSISKSEENQNVEALETESENEERKLKSAIELADVLSKPVKSLEGIEDVTKDLKSEEQSVENSRTELVDENKELKSATELTEHIQLEKNSDEREDQHKELKSEEKQDAVPIQQQQGEAASSFPDCDGEKIEIPVKKYRLIKIPRFTQRVINDEHQAKINDAQVQVDEHTRRRDSLKAELDNMRKVLSECFHKRDSANEEEKKAKTLVNAKRLEMDSLQALISKGKNAAGFIDIISQIHTLEHKMQHETISLKDEKKYLHELNQLKHERELHHFNKCSQLEIDEALKQKETAESSLRTLKKEFDILRSAHLKADEFSKAASKSYIDQFNNVKEHEQKWKTANELRQNAYKNLHGLKSDKMEHYWKYMDDKQAAKKFASSRDMETIERHCTEQVERIMLLWNEDDDFRKQYVESNANNTLRKFGTLDGRTPSVNDPKPVLPSHVSPPFSTRSSPTPAAVCEEQPLNLHKVTKPALPTIPMVRSKLPSESTSNLVATAVAAPPSNVEFIEVEVEKKLTKEEEEQARLANELARKEKELRKLREELELKEKLRMEQKAKAKEAEERKKRKAEKAQAKAEYKAQKEAELKELKRSKKEKKKEAESLEGDLTSVAETSSQEASQEQEINNRTSLKSSRKRSSAALNKYSNKVQPVPLPLRNRGKRKMSTWLWAFCVAVAFVGLFFAGNYISFSVSWLNFSF